MVSSATWCWVGDVLDGMMAVHWRIGRARCCNAQRLVSMGPKQHCLGWDMSCFWHASVATAACTQQSWVTP